MRRTFFLHRNYLPVCLAAVGALVLGLAAAPAHSGDGVQGRGEAVSCKHGHLEAATADSRERADKVQKLASNVNEADACHVVPGVTVQSLDSLWASLVGDARIGGKRFETTVPPGAPTGTIMEGPKGVNFDFGAVAGEELKAFQLVDQTRHRVLVAVRSPKTRFSLPGLNNDDRYAWTLVTGAQTYQARFDMLDKADQDGVESRLSKVDRAGLDPMTRDFYKAAIYDDEGLYAARDALLAHIRAQLSH